MTTLVYNIGAVIVGGFLMLALVAAVLLLRNYIRRRALRYLIGWRRAP